MIIQAKHSEIVKAVTALYPDKPFALDGKDLKWQTETENVLEEPTESEVLLIQEHIALNAS